MSTAPFIILIDNECPLCRAESEFMRRLDRDRGNLKIVDISSPEFDASQYGKTQAEVMGHIHGVTESGAIVTGMEVFRHAYRAVGWGWLFAPTGWPGLRIIFDAMYRWFARNRLRLTGRGAACVDGRCSV